MLTKNIQSIREIPNEPGQQMTFRQLGWRQLTEAEEARSATVLRNLKTMGPELLQGLQTINRDQVENQAAVQAADDPLAKYDQATILLYGIVSWSYPDKLNGENIGTLDTETAKWAATEIVNMGKPPAEKEVEESFFASPSSSMASPATQTVAVSAMLGSTANGSSG